MRTVWAQYPYLQVYPMLPEPMFMILKCIPHQAHCIAGPVMDRGQRSALMAVRVPNTCGANRLSLQLTKGEAMK